MRYSIVAGAVLCLLSGYASAQDNGFGEGDWIIRVGVSNIDPDSSGVGTGLGEVSADDDTSITFTGTYMLSDTLGIELLASTPFEHDIELDGATIGQTKHLPPTLSLQWHFPSGNWKPYAGLGINYTRFYDEETEGPVDGLKLKLDNSWGLAAQAGIDWFMNENWLLNFELRYIQIETDANLETVGDLGGVDIDPILVGLHVGYRF